MNPNNWPYGHQPYFPPMNYYGSQLYSAPTQSSNQVADEPSSTAVAGSSKTKPKGKSKSYETFQEEEEKLLVSLWIEHNDMLNSKDSRKYWSKLVEELNRNYNNDRNVDKCKRRIKYLVDKYKERKDWNKNQSGGRIWKSPHYDEIDSILGTRDVIKLPHIAEAGCSSQSATSTSTTTSPEEASSSNTSSESLKETDSTLNNTKEERRKRKKLTTKEKKEEEQEREEKLLKTVTEQGERMTTVIERFQESQNEQMRMMNTFMTAIAEAIKKST